MKLFTLLTALLLTHVVTAQETSFSGSIVYKVSGEAIANKEKLEMMELHAYFAPNKIRLYMHMDGKVNEESLLIDLDSGLLYTINSDTRKYKVRRLVAATPTSPVLAAPRTVVGYATEPVAVPGQTNMNYLRMLPMKGNFFMARDLHFRIPERFAGAPELMMFRDGRILLAAELDFSFRGSFSEEDEPVTPDEHSSKELIRLEAIRVLPSPCNEDEFRVPSDYVKRLKNDWFNGSVDSVQVTTDSSFATVMADSAWTATDTTIGVGAVGSEEFPYGFTVSTSKAVPGGIETKQVIIPNIETSEGRVVYERIWFTNNRGADAEFGRDYTIVGRWVPKEKKGKTDAKKQPAKRSPARSKKS